LINSSELNGVISENKADVLKRMISNFQLNFDQKP